MEPTEPTEPTELPAPTEPQGTRQPFQVHQGQMGRQGTRQPFQVHQDRQARRLVSLLQRPLLAI